MKNTFDVLIVGGGVVGLTAVLAMAQRGFKTAMIDATSLTAVTTDFDPRVYAINLASQELLTQLAVWQELDKSRLSPYKQMHVWDAANKAVIDFDARLVIAKELGHIVEESILKEALLKQIKKQPAITLFPSSKITTIQHGKDTITIGNDAENWEGKLLMVADGANSPCRQLLNVSLASWSYHQEAIVALVNTEKPHGQTAYQVFNQDGPLAFLPLIDKQLCSIVWSTTPNRAKQLMALSEENFNQALTTAFAQKLGTVTLRGKRRCFPLTMRHVKQYAGKNWLLMGDAAHTIHPLAGLGLNVGLADVSSWLTCLAQTNNRLNKRALDAYQRQRKSAVWQIIALMEGLKALFANPLTPVVALRGLGLQLCNRVVPLKKFFIQQAAGKTIEP
ncbi:FAD-dependent monooxygenase [Legionella jamestowniensis]|uniref:Oxidoreductase with FAD/NAD(P)-binding domain protein n=1 Tax=Legionella jamestowniensis TaxID=455 RepID=A0A0W0UIQ0_9GAMM|nr:FAD-dependent monooxygenase [Legionella jamestowniensis]KTD07774.1 oxidoreductase with FAD/NAD(P)-binding domain protein [Legionella jamestowniensis]SFL61976.1 2-octaprenyl-3-methyl-6-methoxy-1,4-benzoquinol hydroxylase [Legionella jamestowniensis DSM 19215]